MRSTLAPRLAGRAVRIRTEPHGGDRAAARFKSSNPLTSSTNARTVSPAAARARERASAASARATTVARSSDGAALQSVVQSLSSAARASIRESRVASQPIRTPGMPKTLLTPPSVTARSDASQAAGVAAAPGHSPPAASLARSSPRYISSQKRRAPCASHSLATSAIAT